MKSQTDKVLSVRDLVVEFAADDGPVTAVDGVSFDIAAGETVGLVGESGCGKSVTALAVMGLLPKFLARIRSGSIRLNGQELVGMADPHKRRLRGRDVAMIFQEPMTALNPVYTIGNQMGEILRRHQGMSRRQARARALELLALVGIPAPAQRIAEHPHELSGGQRQRVMIAMALSCNPKLLIADEPTTALDVTTQAQVLELMVKLQRELGTAMLLITHDLGVVGETCRRAMVMYCGKLVEAADVAPLFDAPRHPYTRGLLDSMPRIRPDRLKRLPTIAGTVPDLRALPAGCYFKNRCPRAVERCDESHPPLTEEGGRRYACYHPC